jgi:two-component system chemotaxis response regulator CheV
MAIISSKNRSSEERTLQLGSNKFELVDFRLYEFQDNNEQNISTDYEGIYGINIAKVREINKMSKFTKLPNCHDCIEGVLELRDEAIPVVNLAKFLGFQNYKPRQTDNIIICEFNNLVTGFIVHQATRIRRISWEHILPPTRLGGKERGCVTGMYNLDGEKMLLILDFERIVAEMNGDTSVLREFESQKAQNRWATAADNARTVLVVDDSSTARAQVEMHLNHSNFKVITACDGEEGLELLASLHEQARVEKKHLSEYLQVIISDVEMPRIDGYLFTQSVKKDPRFSFLPVILHTSLSAKSNMSQGKNIADDYIVKFNPELLIMSCERLRIDCLEKLAKSRIDGIPRAS